MDWLRVGFIGAGRIADMHYLGYKDNPKARLCAICDADRAVSQQRAADWGVNKIYSDYRRLLDDPDVDAVEIITPHHLHSEMAIAALDAGKHVSVQKPMALNLTQADAMIDAAKRSGRLLRVMENYRYYEPFIRARELIETGEIGEPLSIRLKSITGNLRYGWDIPKSSREWRSDASRSGEGTFVFDHGQHIWSIAKYFLGDVERVFAFIGHTEVVQHIELLPGTLLDTPAMVTWKYAGAERYGSWEAVDSPELMVPSNYYPLDVWAEITGSRGMLWVNQGPPGHMLNRPLVELYRDGITTGLNDLDSDYGTSFARGVHDFVDAILEGRPSELTGPEARDVLRFSLAVVLSGKERREVRLEEIID